MSSRVVIVGAGSGGRELASRLARRHQVLLLDHRPECLEHHGPIRDPEPDVGKTDDGPGIICIRGDGTSRLVLQAVFDSDGPCALVAVTGKDEVNLEVGRLGRAIGFDPVIAVHHLPETAESFRAERITGLNRSQLLADQVERSLRHKGAVVPAGVGLGRGELLEIRLVSTSPVLHRQLKNLAPHRWRVAAVFRGEELIVPTGDTTLEVDDRVLLVGDPDILPTVAEYLRLGTPQFPQPYGPNVVTLEFGFPHEGLFAEAQALACACGATFLVRGAPNVEDDPPQEDSQDSFDPLVQQRCKGDTRRASFNLVPLEHPEFNARLARQRPGVVVTRPQTRSMRERLLGQRGPDADLCDRLRCPVLFARERMPYRRILLPVSSSRLNYRAAEMAIDLTRQLGASLTAVNVDLPRYLSGLSEAEVHTEVVPIRQLCELYEVPLEYRHFEGNPVAHLIESSGDHDLVVVARRRGRRDSFFDPDVAMRLARGARCSVAVLTIWPEE